jgi:mRNA interferase MazF
MVTPQRGDIFWVSLDPTVGSEIRKKRPAIVIEQEESGLEKDSKALAEQIRTISKLRLGLRIGHVGEETMEKVEMAIKVHLELR